MYSSPQHFLSLFANKALAAYENLSPSTQKWVRQTVASELHKNPDINRGSREFEVLCRTLGIDSNSLASLIQLIRSNPKFQRSGVYEGVDEVLENYLSRFHRERESASLRSFPIQVGTSRFTVNGTVDLLFSTEKSTLESERVATVSLDHVFEETENGPVEVSEPGLIDEVSDAVKYAIEEDPSLI